LYISSKYDIKFSAAVVFTDTDDFLLYIT